MFKLSWLLYWTVGMLLLSSVVLVALLVCLEVGNYTVSFWRALLSILAVCKISEAAATVPVMSETGILCVIHG